jgi:hypothetical protein
MTITPELLVCSTTDSAINTAASDMFAYAKSRDTTHLVYNEGMHPVLFSVKRISTDMLLRLREFGKGDRATYRYLCFLSSCLSYKQGEEVVSAELIKNTSVAEDAWLDVLRDEFGMDIIEELVDVSYKFQTLSKRNPYFV